MLAGVEVGEGLASPTYGLLKGRSWGRAAGYASMATSHSVIPAMINEHLERHLYTYDKSAIIFRKAI